MTKFQKDLTQGSVARNLILFSLPFLASNFLQSLYNMGDMFFVGRFYGSVGASAVGVGGQIMILMTNLIAGLAVGGTVLIAQIIGSGRHERLRKTVGTVFTLYGAAAIVLTAVMLLLNPMIVRLLADPQAYDETLRYVQICTAGLFFIFGYNAVSAVLRGMGDSKHPLLFVSIAAGLDLGMNWLFCGPWHMGAAGAAWSTVIAQGLSFVLSAVFLRRGGFVFDFRLKSLRIDKDVTRQLLRIGFPSTLGGTMTTLSFMLLTGIAKSIAGIVGTTALAVTGKANSVAILPAFAMQSAVSSMAGQNLGAGKPKRALRTTTTAIFLTLGFTLVMFLLMQSFADYVVRFFLSGDAGGLDPEIARQCLEQSAVYIRSVSWDYLVVAVVFNITGLAMSAGHTTFALGVGLTSSLLVRAPAAWLLGSRFGLRGMGYAAPLATAVSMVIDLAYLWSGRWKKSKIVHEGASEAIEAMVEI